MSRGVHCPAAFVFLGLALGAGACVQQTTLVPSATTPDLSAEQPMSYPAAMNPRSKVHPLR